MKGDRLLVVAGLALLFLGATGASDEFTHPWTDPSKAIVIDPYEANDIDWDQLAQDSRVVAIIHRATYGAHKDLKYSERKVQALKRHYRWGSYHLGTPGDPIQQADFYLSTIQPGHDEVLALDIESLDPKHSMTLDGARQFLSRVRERTGRYPMIYGNDEVSRHISARFGKKDVFHQAALWYARFRPNIPDFPRGTWDTYTLWQFKSEVNCKVGATSSCPYLVPGTKTDMDVNVFSGSIEDLKARWPFGSEQ